MQILALNIAFTGNPQISKSFIYLFIYSFIYLFIYLLNYLFIYLFIYYLFGIKTYITNP